MLVHQRRNHAPSYQAWRRSSRPQRLWHRRTSVLRKQGETAEASPADFFGSHGSIRPFQGSPWDGRHFCGEDRHVILVAFIDGGDASFDHQQARAVLDPVAISFTLDGAPLDTTRTPIKPFHDPQAFALEWAWYFQEGRIMSPDDLSVGQAEVRALGIARG